MSVALNSVSLASQKPGDRARLLEEKQIGRMVLELQFRRDEAALLKLEAKKLNSLVDKLNMEVARLTELAELHKQAASDRSQALELRDRIQDLYRKSLEATEKEIATLRRKNSLLKLAAGAGTALGLVLGVVLSK